ncbi:MAG TPA: YceI family protein [Verrucomicrobiae bacterium]|nr:YceI family protein [Verrucomicrobiae bacterium]
MKWMLAAGALAILGGFALGSDPPPDAAIVIAQKTSKIEFHASATFMKVNGIFHEWQANLKMPSGKLDDASLDMEIQAASVKTGSGMKDKEVKGRKFFDVEAHPTIRFVSTRVMAGPDPDRYLMDGDLTLRGVTKPVSVILSLEPEEDGHQRLLGDCEFNRREFGMVHNVPFNKVADKVGVKFEFDIVPAAPAAAASGTAREKFAVAVP